MALINTNIPALGAQRDLTSSTNATEKASQRLSSGLRINSAKDDAAGLAIVERMATQILGSNQAIRNTNDGISLAQTAEGALSTSSDMLQRIRELAVQASNATNSPSDRQAIQAEVGQLTSELGRIAGTAAFNGQNLLDGSMGAQTFQVGPNVGNTMTITPTNLNTQTYGNNRVSNEAVNVSTSGTNVQANQTVTVSGYLGAQSYTTTATDTAQSIAQGVNRMSEETGVTATAQTNVNMQLGAESYSLSIQSDNAEAVNVSFTVSGNAATASDFAAGINAINAQTARTGVTAEFDSANGGIKLTNAAGNDINITNNANNNVLKFDIYKEDFKLKQQAVDARNAGTQAAVNGTVAFNSQNSFSVTDSGTGLDLSGTPATTQNSTLQPVASLDVSTVDNATNAISIVDNALATVNEQRAQYGALQSRFESTINNLQVTSENTSAARSRINDADFAVEATNRSRSLILQRTGTAMLAQANQQPERVLALLLQ